MKIGCSSYSFRAEWGKKYEFASPETWKTLKNIYPEIDGWEILGDRLERELKDTETKDLQEYQSWINDSGAEWFALTLGAGIFGVPSAPHYATDAEYLAGFKSINMDRIGFVEYWIDLIAEMGIKQMRVDCMPFHMNHKVNYTDAFLFNLNRNVETYNEICKIAAEHDITVGIENHGGWASDLKMLEKLFERVPALKFVFDFGNVSDANRNIMLDKFVDKISYCHAKAHIFNDEGDEKNMDYKNILNVLKDKGYDGYLSIEWEGPLSGDEGVRKTIDLLKKYR